MLVVDNHFLFVNVDDIAASKEIVQEQKKIDRQDPCHFENLSRLAKQNDMVKSENCGSYFFITHPSKIKHQNAPSLGWFSTDWQENLHYLGWRLYISVHYEDVKNTFDLVAHIINQYSLSLKVANPDHLMVGILTRGQITIFLEEQGQPAISAEDAEKMMKEIETVLLENNIRTSANYLFSELTPPFAVKTSASDFFSFSNNKVMPRLWRAKDDYRPAVEIGRHFNPGNHPNPYSHLLELEKDIQTKPFDPLEHFHAFQADSMCDLLSKTPLFYLTLYAYVCEYTIFDEMDEKTQHEFIFQFCLSNGKNIDNHFLKEPVKNDPAVLLAVKQAFFVIFTFSDVSSGNETLLKYVNSAQFSTHYPFKNSFKSLLIELEEYAKEQIEIGGRKEKKNKKSPALIEKLRYAAYQLTEHFSKEELIACIQGGHFCNASVALNRFYGSVGKEEYIKRLLANQDVPVVQLALAKFYKSENPDKSENYYSKALLSNDTNYMNASERKYTQYVLVLMKYQSLEELEVLKKSGHALATLALAFIYGRDAFKDFPYPEKFEQTPHDLRSAKEWLNDLQANALCSDLASSCIKEINKYEAK